VVSEQTGRISMVKDSTLKRNIKPVELKEMLAREFSSDYEKKKEEERMKNEE
jgi:hypothetical protein